MYISSFYINHFGIFSQTKAQNLRPGLNIFLGPNGGGKSTCLEFLKYMFAGLPDGKTPANYYNMAEAPGSLVMEYRNIKDQSGSVCLKRLANQQIYLTTNEGKTLTENFFNKLFAGITGSIYRHIFAFNLSQLESLKELTSSALSDAMFSATFGTHLNYPTPVIHELNKESSKIYKIANPNKPLNITLQKLAGIRAQITTLKEMDGNYDTLVSELNHNRQLFKEVKSRLALLENEKKQLENRLAVWEQWENWNTLKDRLDKLDPKPQSFPQNALQKMDQIQSEINTHEDLIASRNAKLANLRQLAESRSINTTLLENLPKLLQLSGDPRHNYTKAMLNISFHKNICEKIEHELQNILEELGAYLGSGWDCDKIRATDRSFFLRGEMDKYARELEEANLARQAAVNALAEANANMEDSEHNLQGLRENLASIPQITTELTDKEVSTLRQNFARLTESIRLKSAKQKTVEAAKNALDRAMLQINVKIKTSDPVQSQRLVDNILNKQEAALRLADEIQICIAASTDSKNEAEKALQNVEDIKRLMDKTLADQRKAQGPGREALEVRTKALRSLRALSAGMETEKERISELETRIANERTPSKSRNWFFICIGLIFLLTSAGIFWGCLLMKLSQFSVGDFTIPLNPWGGYGALFCGILLMAAGVPSASPEIKRYKHEMEQLQNRLKNCRSHLTELETKVEEQCKEARVDNIDLITLDAMEMLLEREKEQCFNEERTKKNMEEMRELLLAAKAHYEKCQEEEQEKNCLVQQYRHNWHNLVEEMNLNFVPSIESAPMFFARAEAASAAYDNFILATKELEDLNKNIASLHTEVENFPPVATRLADNMKLEEAVNNVLENCHEVELVAERRIQCEGAIRIASNTFKNMRKKQEQAVNLLNVSTTRLEYAQKKWSQLLEPLGFATNMDPHDVRLAYDTMAQCLETEERLDNAHWTLEQDKQNLATLSDSLQHILTQLERQPKFGKDNKPDWLLTLDELLAEGENNSTILQENTRLAIHVDEEENLLAGQNAALANAQKRMTSLFEEARAKDEQEFIHLAKQEEERERIIGEMAKLESALSVAAAPDSFAEFIDGFSASKQEEQINRLKEIETEIENDSNLFEATAKKTGSLENAIDNLISRDDVGRLLQQESILQADIAKLFKNWSVCSLAEKLLNRAKNIYEQEKQPELLLKASGLFNKITSGVWRGIHASLEDHSLVMVREDGEILAPEKLSEGTREQAYLALRFAYIIKHAEEYTPLPVLMDEALVNFDRERASCTARMFASLGEEQQVLFFTCHRHMVDMLKDVCPQATLFRIETGKFIEES